MIHTNLSEAEPLEQHQGRVLTRDYRPDDGAGRALGMTKGRC